MTVVQAKANTTNMVVTDLNMPGIIGLEFIHEFRQLPPYRSIPIVFLTTESYDGIKQQAKAQGTTGWITKHSSRGKSHPYRDALAIKVHPFHHEMEERLHHRSGHGTHIELRGMECVSR